MMISLRLIGLIAGNTVREAVRQRLAAVVVVLAVALVAGARYLQVFNFGAPELRFIADLGLGAIGVLGAVLAVTTTAQLFFAELEQRTVLPLLAKPVGRTEFVFGKFCGAAAMVTAFCAVLLGLLALVLWSREMVLLRESPAALPDGRMLDYGWLVVTGVLLWLKLLMASALTLLVASYARSHAFAVVLGFLLWVIGHLQHVMLEASMRSGAAMLRAGAWVAASVLPDYQRFGFPEARMDRWQLLGAALGYGVVYSAAACGLAAFLFRRREI